jgi:hypothetical protein
MEVVMKKIFMALVILSSLVSCGKSNTVGDPAVVSASASAITITTLPAGSQQIANQLGTIVNNNQFGTGIVYTYTNPYGELFSQYVTHAPNTTYSYGALATAAQTSNCKTVAYIFTYCSTGLTTTSNTSVAVTRTVIHSAVDLTAKQNEIIAIINKTNQIVQLGNGVYQILTTDNINYFIDTKYPIQANPVQTQQATGTGEVLIKF